MKTYLISLEYVTMALRRASYLRTTKAVAVSSPYGPLSGRGSELLHGGCLIIPLQ